MYGMVNQALKQMTLDTIGESEWSKICNNLQISSKDFDSFSQFDDSVTLGLVQKICEVSSKNPQDFLKEFGIYWIKFAQESDYQVILNAFAKSPFDLINSLNSLHERLELSFTNLNAPSFEIIQQDEISMIVNYYSLRDMPLQFFVKGLFVGIFKMFNEICEVEIIETIGDAKATFLIKKINE